MPANLREHVEAVHAWQVDVEQHDVELADRQPLERLGTVARLLDEIPGLDQHLRQHVPQLGVVIDDEDAPRHRGFGAHAQVV